MALAFDDVRVLDLSRRMSGAYAARLFGDFGAEVIMVEDSKVTLLGIKKFYMHI